MKKPTAYALKIVPYNETHNTFRYVPTPNGDVYQREEVDAYIAYLERTRFASRKSTNPNQLKLRFCDNP